MSPLFFCTLIYTLCVLPTHASWLPGVSWHRLLRSESLTSHKGVGIAPDTSPGSTKSGNTTTTPYIFSVPSASIIAPTTTSQGMMVTSILPIYEVCDMPGKNTTSCSTAFETITTESCSTVLTYAFTKTTISDCVHNVTFSSRTTYALATTTLSAATTDLKARDAASPTPITYVQSTVLAYAAPWQSLAADTPGGITVMVCISDVTGSQICVLIEEIWAVHTEYVPITVTSTLSLSTSFSSDVVLLLGPTQSLVAPAGNFTLSTLVEYSTMSPNATTSIVISTTSADAIEAGMASIVDSGSPIRTSTTTSTRTVTTTGDTSAVTKTLSLVRAAEEPTTTLTSTTTLTRTVTVRPTRKP
ncbi:hypothetical protein DL95DRAFT_469465 [Leptodontidium sp. 2 PMI_412]|nr:hypothetical protein DL95DRAFT_469465 [Leptodontidium sp. 2 PMI_412]